MELVSVPYSTSIDQSTDLVKNKGLCYAYLSMFLFVFMYLNLLPSGCRRSLNVASFNLWFYNESHIDSVIVLTKDIIIKTFYVCDSCTTARLIVGIDLLPLKCVKCISELKEQEKQSTLNGILELQECFWLQEYNCQYQFMACYSETITIKRITW